MQTIYAQFTRLGDFNGQFIGNQGICNKAKIEIKKHYPTVDLLIKCLMHVSFTFRKPCYKQRFAVVDKTLY